MDRWQKKTTVTITKYGTIAMADIRRARLVIRQITIRIPYRTFELTGGVKNVAITIGSNRRPVQ
jgi:hypothetical protein